MTTSAPSRSDRLKPAILLLAVLFVVLPFLFWRSTWFGVPLSDAEMAEKFADHDHPRKIQHALTQVAERIVRGDNSVRRWYPQVVASSIHPKDEIRQTAAWVMGQDNTAAEFRDSLLKLLADPNPMVRHNAALSLVRFGDASGRADILGMLVPYPAPAPAAGRLAQRLMPSDTVNPGTLLGRIEAGEEVIEIRSQVPGRVVRWLKEDQEVVAVGEGVVLIAPSPEMVWEALRALALIGQPEDLALIEPYTRGVEGMPAEIVRQAVETIKRIRSRHP